MPKILIVDDDEKVADYISTCLAAHGHSCVKATSVRDAHMRLAVEGDIALLVLDHSLGVGENGLGLLAELRAAQATKGLPALVCSGEARPEIVQAFASLRVSSFIRKPFRPERLAAEVNRALGLAK
jgi:CheY-like chemotaxis protein